MATVNNLRQVAEEALQNAELTDSSQEGVEQFTVEGTDITVFTSSTNEIFLLSNEVNHAILTGNADVGVTGNSNDNLIVGNEGDNKITTGAGVDQVATGAGNDTIFMGAGNDVVEIDGGGIKTISGGDGDDTFIVFPSAMGADSEFLFTDLSRGDKLRIAADVNGDGNITLDDLGGIEEVEGGVKLTLSDGTTFTLQGVSEVALQDGSIQFDIFTDENGNLMLELSAADAF